MNWELILEMFLAVLIALVIALRLLRADMKRLQESRDKQDRILMADFLDFYYESKPIQTEIAGLRSRLDMIKDMEKPLFAGMFKGQYGTMRETEENLSNLKALHGAIADHIQAREDFTGEHLKQKIDAENDQAGVYDTKLYELQTKEDNE